MFAQMREPLLQCKQCRGNFIGIGVGNIAPHGEGAATQARHLAQSPATNGAHVLCAAELVFKQRGQVRSRPSAEGG